MTIKVLGSGCPTCHVLFVGTKQAVEELMIDAEVLYVNDIQEILALGAMSSPVLAIDGKIALAGQVPGVDKIKEIISTYIKSESGEPSCCSRGCC